MWASNLTPAHSCEAEPGRAGTQSVQRRAANSDPRYRARIPPTTQAMAALPDTKVLIRLVVDMTKMRDVDYHTRATCTNAILPKYPTTRIALSVSPLTMRMGGPRMAIGHCLLHKY